MEQDDIKAVTKQLAYLLVIANQLNQNHQTAVQQVSASAGVLDLGVQQLHADTERFASDVTRTVGAQARQVIAEGTAQAVAELNQQLRASGSVAQVAAQTMEAQRRRLVATQRSMVWISLSALVIGSLLSVGGAVYAVRQSRQAMDQAHFAADILQATQNGAITRCGTSLCVNAGKKPQRYGQNGDYLLLQK